MQPGVLLAVQGDAANQSWNKSSRVARSILGAQPRSILCRSTLPLTLRGAAIISARIGGEMLAAACFFRISGRPTILGESGHPAGECSHAQYHFCPQGGPQDRAA